MIVSEMISKRRILHKGPSTMHAQIGSLTRVLAIMNAKCLWQCESFSAFPAFVRTLAGVGADVLSGKIRN